MNVLYTRFCPPLQFCTCFAYNLRRVTSELSNLPKSNRMYIKLALHNQRRINVLLNLKKSNFFSLLFSNEYHYVFKWVFFNRLIILKISNRRKTTRKYCETEVTRASAHRLTHWTSLVIFHSSFIVMFQWTNVWRMWRVDRK